MQAHFPRAAVAAACLCACAVQAQESITVRGHYDNAVGTSDAASQGVIEAELLKSRPALRPGEVLEFVPGLIVTQHSGDGKANQYFLRGFNLDHGTDFATRVDGMPVNMPTHGHGQGYTDLNFLLPELVQRIEYRKGPYFASNGDFASAGSADVLYLKRLDAPFAQLTLGAGNFRRAVAAGSGDVGGGLTLLGALELQRNDGPWTVPERLHKDNAVLTLSGGAWSATLMGYRARWTATDQVPERLILDGGIGRFDSLDPTTGGRTHRHSASVQWSGNGTRVSAYAIDYALDLYSNFSYATQPDGNDQFRQFDDRRVVGVDARHAWSHRIAGLDARSEIGATLRQDRITVGLYDTAARKVVGTVREDRVRETMTGLWGQTSVELLPTLRAIAGLRADRVGSRVSSLSTPGEGGSASATQGSPKIGLVAGPFAKTEFFVNAGRGLHSNDARGTTARTDPAPPLAASRGWELGARTEALPGLQSSVALWKLEFDSELVYVGDAGSTEAAGASRRRGVEWNNRWIPLPWLLFDADLAWTHARFVNSPQGDRIPNAIDRVASLAAAVRERGPWSASLQWRYLGSGALIEDNSVRSRPSLTTNLRLGWRFSPRVEALLDVFNLSDRKVDDIQYFYESQLPGEPAPVADRHLHPAEPRSARVTLKVTL